MISGMSDRPARLPREIPIEEVDGADLKHLIDIGIPEGQHLEYKRELWAKSRDGCREMIKDISAFANADGGDLIVGIEEREGELHALLGIAIQNPDEVLRGIQDRLLSGLEPPVSGVRMRWITIGGDCLVLFIRVPSSPSGPHRNIYSRDFHIRNNTMASTMGVQQLREAFAGTDRLIERLRNLHHSTLNRQRPELPFSLENNATAVMSLLPLDLFRARRDLDVTSNTAVRPLMCEARGMDYHILLEGVAWNAGLRPPVAYTLTYRAGWLEAAWTIGRIVDSGPVNNQPLVFKDLFENTLSDLVDQAQQVFYKHGVYRPWVLMISLLRLNGYHIAKSDIGLTPPTSRTEAHLPEVVGSTIHVNNLLPTFKAFWRVFGLERPA